jgi:hypothetical protein
MLGHWTAVTWSLASKFYLLPLQNMSARLNEDPPTRLQAEKSTPENINSDQ